LTRILPEARNPGKERKIQFVRRETPINPDSEVAPVRGAPGATSESGLIDRADESLPSMAHITSTYL